MLEFTPDAKWSLYITETLALHRLPSVLDFLWMSDVPFTQSSLGHRVWREPFSCPGYKKHPVMWYILEQEQCHDSLLRKTTRRKNAHMTNNLLLMCDLHTEKYYYSTRVHLLLTVNQVMPTVCT